MFFYRQRWKVFDLIWFVILHEKEFNGKSSRFKIEGSKFKIKTPS